MSFINKKLIVLLICFLICVELIFNKVISNRNFYKNKKFIKDVLFITGCDKNSVPHLNRYRVLHQMEQLYSGFLESNQYFYLNFEPSIVADYRVIILYRCPWTEKIGEAIELAKSLNKKVLFDIDDLIFNKNYTDISPYVKFLSKEKKSTYDDYVIRMGKTLKICDGVITTTEVLAGELKKFISNVFINRNVANEEMWKLSQEALIKKGNKIKDYKIIIGYFCGNIIHNSDLEMIKPILIKILREFKNVQLSLLGKFNISDFMKEFSSQIIFQKYIDWRKLPEKISNFDINIVPLENNIFNSVKSENKWIEASLLKVPTIASNFGVFKDLIKHNITGLLCSDLNDWYISLKNLINDEHLRGSIGENAYINCKEKYNTLYSGYKLVKYINSITNKHIGFYIPTLEICGGIHVILKHAYILKRFGWDVDLILPEGNINFFSFQDQKFKVICLNNSVMTSQYDIIIATFYSTLYSVLNYYRTKKHLYLVQNYETDFYAFGNILRAMAEKTYSVNSNVEYITISKWCKNWLWKKYGKKSRYAPNGIDFNNYNYYKRNLNKKRIRILIEGDSNSYFKNVDESFKIIEKLDKNKFEVLYLSYNGLPKKWYKLDKFFYKIPYEKVKEIYYNSDILIKSSWLESFSYPPLEMLATGGFVIAVPNGGNKEYLKHKENCLYYKLGDIDSAFQNIMRLISDIKLQKHLYEQGLKTAKSRDWKNFENQIIKLYNT